MAKKSLETVQVSVTSLIVASLLKRQRKQNKLVMKFEKLNRVACLKLFRNLYFLLGHDQ